MFRYLQKSEQKKVTKNFRSPMDKILYRNLLIAITKAKEKNQLFLNNFFFLKCNSQSSSTRQDNFVSQFFFLYISMIQILNVTRSYFFQEFCAEQT